MYSRYYIADLIKIDQKSFIKDTTKPFGLLFYWNNVLRYFTKQQLLSFTG